MYSKLWPELDFTGAKITPQDITFERKFTIYEGDMEIQLISVGPAHSPSDAFVYLPKEKVVFCGDLLFCYCTPFALMGYMSGYIDALDLLADLDVEVYVPGHGPPCGREGLHKARQYLVLVRDKARKCFDKGMSYYEAAKKVDLREFRKWANSERIVGNLARAYSEFRNEEPAAPLNYAEILPQMMEFAQSEERA